MSVTAGLFSCPLGPATTNTVLLSGTFWVLQAIQTLTLAVYLFIASNADWEDPGLKTGNDWLSAAYCKSCQLGNE